jgi:hypothetical protein
MQGPKQQSKQQVRQLMQVAGVAAACLPCLDASAWRINSTVRLCARTYAVLDCPGLPDSTPNSNWP